MPVAGGCGMTVTQLVGPQDPPLNIHDALAAVMDEVTKIDKGDRNDFHNFMFRGIDRVLNNVGPAFRNHGIVPLPELVSLDSRDLTTEKGKTAREVTVVVIYTFLGPAGDSVKCKVPGEASDVSDKAVSKAMSVAYRTALIQTLAIPTGDADPDATTIVRGVDVLTEIKQEIMSAAVKKGWDVERLAYEFGEWSQGADLRTADLDTLKQYLAVLKPPRKAQRAPVPDAPELATP